MKRVITYYLKPYYFRMGIGFTIKFIGSVMDLCLPWILAHIIDEVIPQQNIRLIWLWGAAMILCAFIAVLFNVIANRMASRVATWTTRAIRHDLFAKTMYLSRQQMDDFTKPSLISRLTTDTYNVNNMLARIQRLGVRAPILLIGGIIFTMAMEPALSAVLIAVMPFLVLAMTQISKKGMPLYRRLQEAADKMVCLVREDIAGIRVIKALSKTGYEKEKFAAVNEDVIQSERKAEVTMAVLDPTTSFLLNMGLVGVILVGAYRVNAGISEVGKILAFMTYFTIILNAMMSISRMFVMISKAAASAARIEQVLSTEDDLPVMEAAADGEKVSGDESIRFEHVTFSYHKAEPDLEDIHFSVKKGEMLGIIGSTGSGKTTLAALLMRLMDPDEGRIFVNGQDVRLYDKQDLRSRFGVVFQNDTLFEDTIHENVRMGRCLSEEQLDCALKMAQAHEFTKEKERTEGAKLDIRGANLSGGQKQRVLVARALADKPEFLVLDDSSSALDYRTDARLRKEIREKLADTTTVMIAQRVSSVMHADHIMVLEEGKMIGYGTHEELLQSCSVYREISYSQTGVGAV
ncbi:MAG: ABC transporter ATP-binding protein [Lachnospiraceae bacterium]|nr:ABC transporter ATP-binding protein [Lachnospiraceae bacterium]